MGIKYLILAINKMDLVNYEYYRFENIKNHFLDLTLDFDLYSIQVTPLSATKGENIVTNSEKMDCYKGKSLHKYIEDTNIKSLSCINEFIMPVQRVCRQYSTFRGYSGQIETGNISVKDKIVSMPICEFAIIKKIFVGNHKCTHAIAGQAITITLDREIDVSRGCVLVSPSLYPHNGKIHSQVDSTLSYLHVSNSFDAKLLWIDDSPLIEGRIYLLKCSTKILPTNIEKIKYVHNIDRMKRMLARNLRKTKLECAELFKKHIATIPI